MKLLFLTHAATAPAINSAPRFTQRCLVPESFTPTERTRVVREPHRGVYDRQEIYKILDEGIVCHVGFIADAQPFVIPTLYARAGDAIYFHGSAAGRMVRGSVAWGFRCLKGTPTGGFVVAGSVVKHSMN